MFKRAKSFLFLVGFYRVTSEESKELCKCPKSIRQLKSFIWLSFVVQDTSKLKTRLFFTSLSFFFSPVDEGVGHKAQLLNLSALLLSQVLHGLLGVKAGPAGAVAVDLPLVLPGLQRALERLVVQRYQRCRLRNWSLVCLFLLKTEVQAYTGGSNLTGSRGSSK